MSRSGSLFDSATADEHSRAVSPAPTATNLSEEKQESPALAAATGGLPDSHDPKTPTDLEKGADGKDAQLLSKASPPVDSDPNLVTWSGPTDPANPKNWTRRRKWLITITVSSFTFMSPLASSMVAPALPQISQQLHMTPGSVLEAMSLSIFILAYAVGPLFLGPLSELYGRQLILQSANLLFLVFNIGCGVSQTTAQLLVCRFFAGLGGSAPMAIGGGTISDLFNNDERGLAVSIYSLAPLTGPALGPVAGGWVAERSSWRWVFYATSIADGFIQVIGLLLLRETYGPKILADKAKKLRRETGNPKLHTQWERPDRTVSSVVIHGLLRPMTLLVTEPIVQVMASYMAVLYGLMYLTLTTFPTLWTETYHLSVGIGGLHYIAISIGFCVGAQVGARALDMIYANLKAKNGGVGTPEMRMPLMMVTVFLVPIGLIIYGWSAEYAVFWLVPDIGVAILAAGIIGAFLPIQTYLIDNFQIHAASAIGAASSFRSLAGFGFPLFASAMFKKLGNGWGNSVLALVALIFLPAPFFFYKYGPWLRSKSRYTKRSQ